MPPRGYLWLWTPRARATDIGQGPHLRRGVWAGSLRASEPSAREKTRGQKRKKCRRANKTHLYILIVISESKKTHGSYIWNIMLYPSPLGIIYTAAKKSKLYCCISKYPDSVLFISWSLFPSSSTSGFSPPQRRSGQAMMSGDFSSPHRYLPSFLYFITHASRVQQHSHFDRVRRCFVFNVKNRWARTICQPSTISGIEETQEHNSCRSCRATMYRCTMRTMRDPNI